MDRFKVFSVTAAQLTDVHCVCLKAYFHYCGCAYCCMALRGDRNRNTVRVSVSLATQRNAMNSCNGNEPSCVTPHQHTGTAAVSHAQRMPDQMHDGRQPAPAWGVVGERGKERRQTHDVHAHSTHMILYSTASIEASLENYTNKNIILGPARMTDTQLVLNLYRPTP